VVGGSCALRVESGLLLACLFMLRLTGIRLRIFANLAEINLLSFIRCEKTTRRSNAFGYESLCDW
jgi:hypothetical protein